MFVNFIKNTEVVFKLKIITPLDILAYTSQIRTNFMLRYVWENHNLFRAQGF